MTTHTTLSALLASTVLLAAAAAQAADVFPVKAYTKPEEGIVVKFVNEKTPDAKAAVTELGLAAAKLDALFTPAPAADIASADGAAAFKIYSVSGEELKLSKVTPTADGTVDLADVCPKIKEGGTFFLVWKDATPLVIESLFNPTYQLVKAKIQAMAPDQKKLALDQYGPVVTHIELAEIAVITTDKGVIKAKFAYDDAPHTVDNFTTLVRQNFYDGTNFHRIIAGFMIQGGDAFANVAGKAGLGGPGYDVVHEFSDKKHVKGVLSMARSAQDVRAPQGGTQTTAFDTAGSQFFIMHGTNPNLDGAYTAFGDVIEGLDVVDAIAKTPVSDNNGTVTGAKPKIVSIKIMPATAATYGLK